MIKITVECRGGYLGLRPATTLKRDLECCAKLLDYPRALSRRAREPRTADGYGDYPIYLMEPGPGSAP